MKQFETNGTQNYAYSCKYCNFNTNKKNDYSRHIQTIKHKNFIKLNETIITHMKQNNAKKHQCYCGKELNSRTTLWRK